MALRPRRLEEDLPATILAVYTRNPGADDPELEPPRVACGGRTR